MSEEAEKPIRVERSYYPDGALKEEVHYRGVSEHGPWRKWHANGQLAFEAWLDRGVYMNCTNRTWYPDGTLQSEAVFTNGKMTASRSFNARGKALPSLADQQRKSLRAMFAKAQAAKPRRPQSVDEHAAAQALEFIEDRLRGRKEDARVWLRQASESSNRTLGEFDREQSIELIDGLLALGAIEVLAVGIEVVPGGDDQTANHLVLQLPEGVDARARVFVFCNAYARSLGFDPEADHGQQQLYLMLC